MPEGVNNVPSIYTVATNENNAPKGKRPAEAQRICYVICCASRQTQTAPVSTSYLINKGNRYGRRFIYTIAILK